MFGNLAFKNRSYQLFGKAIKKGVRGVLASKTVLKMHCRSSSKYLTMKDIANNIAKGFRAELRIELEVKSFFKIEDLSNLSILLLIRKETWDIGAIKGATGDQFL